MIDLRFSARMGRTYRFLNQDGQATDGLAFLP